MGKIGGVEAIDPAGPGVAASGPTFGPSRAIPDPVHGSAWITQRLRQAILDGGYGHGDKLPAERQLADAFGAARGTVRLALDRLEAERLVTRRIGSGTFVNFGARRDAGDVIDSTSPLELIDVRLGVEPNMIRLAVLHATARDIGRLRQAIERMAGASGNPEGFTRWDQEFHMLIAECTHNPLMMWLYRQVNAVRGHAQWNAMKDKVLTPARIAEYNRQHRAMFEAIESRDVESAMAIVANHLHYARRQLQGVASE